MIATIHGEVSGRVNGKAQGGVGTVCAINTIDTVCTISAGGPGCPISAVCTIGAGGPGCPISTVGTVGTCRSSNAIGAAFQATRKGS